MPDFAPNPPLLTEEQCSSVKLQSITRVCRELVFPAFPAVGCLLMVLYRIVFFSNSFLIWCILLVLMNSSILASWIMFWRPADPIHCIPILEQDSLTKESREKSFGEKQKPSKDKVLVVGAGFAGLAASAALMRRGIAFEVIDGQDDIGGLWYTGGYHNVHILSSKRITEFKDLPMPKDYPDCPSQEQMMKYFRSYVDHWKLRDFIRFNTKVNKVTPLEEGGSGYKIVLSDGSEHTYRGLVVCVGHHRIPNPIHDKFPGKFSGEVIHSSEYKTPEQLSGKRVLVVGAGNSAMDICVEAGYKGASSHSSMRGGRWFTPRLVFGMPSLEINAAWWPWWFTQLFNEAAVFFNHGFYQRYKIPFPNHRFGQFHPTISTAFLESISFGRITAHPNIRSFAEKVVTFEDGATEEIDLIIYCSGYKLDFPLLKDFVHYEHGIPQLLHGAAIPGKKNLYCLGVQQPRYGGGPLLTRGAEVIAEMIEIQKLMSQSVLDYVGKLFYPVEYPFYVAKEVKCGKEIRVSPDLITDPFSLSKRIQIMRAFIPLLPWLSRTFPLTSKDWLLNRGRGSSDANSSVGGGPKSDGGLHERAKIVAQL